MECALVIVADRLEHPRAFCVTDGETQRILVKLESLRHGGPFAGRGTRGQQGSKGPFPQFGTGDRVVGPGEVRVLAQDCCPVMVRDQFSKLLRAIPGDLLEPAGGLRMRACPPDPRQARVGHVPYQGVFEDEFELAGNG